MELMEVPQMAINDNAEHVRVLSLVREGIEGLRRRVQELQPELSTSTSEAVNIARQEMCASLVRRLVMAEKEVQELRDMLELSQKA
jgi:hypothetical protein